MSDEILRFYVGCGLFSAGYALCDLRRHGLVGAVLGAIVIGFLWPILWILALWVGLGGDDDDADRAREG